MKNIIKDITLFSNMHDLLPNDQTYVVGFSGGADSMLLLHYLSGLQNKKNIKIIAAHLDHGWRKSSSNDVKFCEKMAKSLNIPFALGHLNDYKSLIKYNGSQEELARKARHIFFHKIAHTHDAHKIALGHHADDQQETFFIRLLRGTSLTGLTCMKPRHGKIIRPLLETNKKDIVSYLAEKNIPFLHDPTNDSDNFLRNRIRHTLIPAIKLCDERFNHTFSSTISRLKEDEALLKIITFDVFEKTTEKKDNNTVCINLASFLQHPQALLYRLITHWLCTHNAPFVPSQTFFDEILRFLKTPHGGVHQITKSWSIAKKHGYAYIILNQEKNKTKRSFPS